MCGIDCSLPLLPPRWLTKFPVNDCPETLNDVETNIVVGFASAV